MAAEPGNNGDALIQILESSAVAGFANKAKERPNRVSPALQDNIARIPSELYDYIIDHLHDDRLALSACTLVCKAWHASSTYQLFQNAGTIRVYPTNFQQFRELRILAGQRLDRCIGRLDVRSGSHKDVGGPENAFHFTDEMKGFQGLLNVKYLRLTDHTHAHSYETPFTAILPNLSTITHLELDLSFESFAYFLQLLDTIPLLRGLALHRPFDQTVNSEPPTPPLRPPFIRRLAIGPLNYSFTSPLRQRARIALVSDVLRTLGPRLEHLVISSRFLLSGCDLSHSTALRTLRINSIQTRGAWLLDLLSQIRTHVLERIVLVVDLCVGVGLHTFDWPRIVASLNKLESLRRVDFFLFSPNECAVVEEKLGAGIYTLRVTSWEGSQRPQSNYGLEIFEV
ncbi:hypothetical protein B0H17DRAFT_1100506 [Mycena rosella]|uniref:F-box domain-containing protein n=1 Tax=Mycena rosella TaxID=1033263 RepID=A0AAD7CMR1_MYCRO|nr:hypothetical protein B0H17DRAFT_1100506 [Mycena rosella]